MLSNAIQILLCTCETVRNTEIDRHAKPHCCLHLFLRQLSSLGQYWTFVTVFFGISLGPYRVTGNLFLSNSLGPSRSAVSIFWAAAWAHTKALAAPFRQLYGPIQECWQHLLGNCMGPYRELSSTHQVALWAHTGLLAAFFRQLHGPIQKTQHHSSGSFMGPSGRAGSIFGSSMGPYKEHGSTHQAALWAYTGFLAAFPQAALWAHLGGAGGLAAFFRQLHGPIQRT
jgi:hypothetical protein